MGERIQWANSSQKMGIFKVEMKALQQQTRHNIEKKIYTTNKKDMKVA